MLCISLVIMTSFWCPLDVILSESTKLDLQFSRFIDMHVKYQIKLNSLSFIQFIHFFLIILLAFQLANIRPNYRIRFDLKNQQII